MLHSRRTRLQLWRPLVVVKALDSLVFWIEGLFQMECSRLLAREAFDFVVTISKYMIRRTTFVQVQQLVGLYPDSSHFMVLCSF